MSNFINTPVKEPLIRVVKRDNTSFWYRLGIRAISVVIAISLIVLLTILLSDISVSKNFKYIFTSAFTNTNTIYNFLKDACMLLGIAIALVPAFKMKFWNIGAQGQVLMGALFSASCIHYVGTSVSEPILLVLMLCAGILGGALWALIPAIFKVKFNANETLFTLMMNYVAIQMVQCFIDIWKGKAQALGTFSIGVLPALFDVKYMLIYLIIVALCVFIHIYMSKTKHGYEIAVVGESINTAKYAGMNTNKITIRTIILSGAICGLCGFLYVSSEKILSPTLSGAYGFTAIIVAWSAHFNPIAMFCISVIIAFLEKGASSIADHTKADLFNDTLANIYVAIFLLFLIGCEFFINYRLVFRSRKRRA